MYMTTVSGMEKLYIDFPVLEMSTLSKIPFYKTMTQFWQYKFQESVPAIECLKLNRYLFLVARSFAIKYPKSLAGSNTQSASRSYHCYIISIYKDIS